MSARSSQKAMLPLAKLEGLHMQLPICPLTLELPTNPVVAQDGRVYEAHAWKMYIKTSKSKNKVVSPITKKRISSQVYASSDIRTMIESAVRNGDVPDDLCIAWKEKLQRDVKFAELIKAAKKEDLEYIGDCYNYGIDTHVCHPEALKYYEKSYKETHNLESYRKMIIIHTLQPDATRTQMIFCWALMCQLSQKSKSAACLVEECAENMHRMGAPLIKLMSFLKDAGSTRTQLKVKNPKEAFTEFSSIEFRKVKKLPQVRASERGTAQTDSIRFQLHCRWMERADKNHDKDLVLDDHGHKCLWDRVEADRKQTEEWIKVVSNFMMRNREEESSDEESDDEDSDESEE